MLSSNTCVLEGDIRTSLESEEEHEDPPTVQDDGELANSENVDIEKTAGISTPQTLSANCDKHLNVSRTVSASSKAMSVVKVPRKQRHGLFARFSVVYEAEEPKNYPRKVKWIITFWTAIAAITAPMGSSIILPALTDITHDFHTDATVANLSVALYMLSMSVFPLWWSSFSESAGRRTVYLTAFLLYMVLNVAAALSTNISMFIAFRFLSGGASASVQAVGAGTIADCWDVHERGMALSAFYLGPLCGPLIAPIIGGGLTESLGWRSTQWFQVIFGAAVWLGILFFLPETHRLGNITAKAESQAIAEIQGEEKATQTQASNARLSRTTSRQSIAIKTRKWGHVLYRIFIEPLTIIRYLRFPAVALTVYYASIAFGCLYFLNISVEKTFSASPYNFSVISVGLLYLSNSLGYFVTSVFGGQWVDRIMAREARKAGRFNARGKLIYQPEDRLKENAWLGAILMPIALLWYGWTADRGVYWFVPILANFFFGAGSMLIFAAAITMLTEFMPKKASNGVALNNFVRNIFSFLGTLLAEPLIDAIGNGWLFTILAAIALFSCFVIVLMKRNSQKWRETMDREMD